MPKAKPKSDRRKNIGEETAMVTPQGIHIWVPANKVAIKKTWGWKIIPGKPPKRTKNKGVR